MSHHPDTNLKEERVGRRERLRLLCAADRTRLRLVWRLPAALAKHEHEQENDHAWVGTLLTGPALTALLPFVPGKLGQWGRRLRVGLGVVRTVMRVAT